MRQQEFLESITNIQELIMHSINNHKTKYNKDSARQWFNFNFNSFREYAKNTAAFNDNIEVIIQNLNSAIFNGLRGHLTFEPDITKIGNLTQALINQCENHREWLNSIAKQEKTTYTNDFSSTLHKYSGIATKEINANNDTLSGALERYFGRN